MDYMGERKRRMSATMDFLIVLRFLQLTNKLDSFEEFRSQVDFFVARMGW